MSDFIPPHRTLSRPVEASDIARVMTEAEKMHKLIRKYGTCVALAHPQITDEDPLRFFVLNPDYARDFKGPTVILNPEIIERSSARLCGKEGCMTYPGRPHLAKFRNREIVLRFQKPENGFLSAPITLKLSGITSVIVQHETDHLNAIYCYDN